MSLLRMRRFRIAAISYLNTAPLMWDFIHGKAARDFDISYTLPATCAAALREGSADIGIIPAIAYTSIPDLVIIPEVAIAAKGPVRSILLVSKVPLEEIRTVATDNSSLSSVGLAKVVFNKWLGGNRDLLSLPPDLPSMLQACDAALIIGDPALKVDRSRYHVFDLAEQWWQFTGKPFVFAFWAVRQDALADTEALELASIFQQSRDHGLEPVHLGSIAREWAPRVGISEDEVRAYLTRNIHYVLDPECLSGMQLFFRYAAELGVVDRVPPLRFLQPLTATSISRLA